jgi:hypothetical protein
VQPGPGVPDAFKLNMMIRTAIIALNQANQTGNYTVLRDLGGASFRATNDASRLAEIFADLRRRQLDLSPILFFTPKILAQPQIDPRGILRLVGYFPTAPEVVKFDIYYVQEAGSWRLFGIGVTSAPAEATAALPAPNAGQPSPAPASAAQPAPPQPQAAAKPAAAAPAKPAPKAAEAPAQPKPAATKPPSAKPEAKARPQPPRPGEGAGQSAGQNWTADTATRPNTPQAGAPSASINLTRGGEAQKDVEAPASESKDKPDFFPFW